MTTHPKPEIVHPTELAPVNPKDQPASAETSVKLVAFLGLGVLLLSVSYLYSRFRPMIEKLWKDDPSA